VKSVYLWPDAWKGAVIEAWLTLEELGKATLHLRSINP
jgi:hypothetical protein